MYIVVICFQNCIFVLTATADPATLTDSEFETFYAAMIFNRRNELKDIEVTIHNALITVLEKVFPNGI